MDIAGRLSLADMRAAVRRRIDALRFTIVEGVETDLLQTNPLVSDQDIDLFLNTALTKRSVDVSVGDNTIMADEALIDVVADTIEYLLPDDMMFLRALYWKNDTRVLTQVPPNERFMMYENDSDEPISQQLVQSVEVPTYRRRLNMLVLNQVPQIDNPGGILVDYTKHFLPLFSDDQIIESPLAQIIQQIVILDAVIEIVTERMKLDATELRTTLSGLESRLEMAVLNYHAPKTIRMVTGVVLVRPPLGRGNRSWNNKRRVWG